MADKDRELEKEYWKPMPLRKKLRLRLSKRPSTPLKPPPPRNKLMARSCVFLRGLLRRVA